MDHRWSALCAALLCAHTLWYAASEPALIARLRQDAGSGALSLALLELELGLPRTEARLAALLPGTGTSPVGEGSGPSPAPVFSPEDTPAPASETASSSAPEPTAPPVSSPPPTPDPTPSPAPTAEVRPFTDARGVAVKNTTGYAVDIPALMAEELKQRLPESGPQILIIHTHGTEAYLPSPGEEYQASDAYRTTDPAHSVIRVGDALQQRLESYGLRVIHDRALYDYPSYTGSYSRSEAAVEDWLRRYPGIAVVIDVHRDAVGSENILYKTAAQLETESAAQVMLVMGTGENGLEHPLWRENLKLALAMQSAAASLCPTLTRPISLVPERYNQHLTTGSFILEVGTNGNTLPEAIRAAELFADAAASVFLTLTD